MRAMSMASPLPWSPSRASSLGRISATCWAGTPEKRSCSAPSVLTFIWPSTAASAKYACPLTRPFNVGQPHSGHGMREVRASRTAAQGLGDLAKRLAQKRHRRVGQVVDQHVERFAVLVVLAWIRPGWRAHMRTGLRARAKRARAKRERAKRERAKRARAKGANARSVRDGCTTPAPAPALVPPYSP